MAKAPIFKASEFSLLSSTFMRSKSLRKIIGKVDLPRKIFPGYDPQLNFVTPPVARKVVITQETGTVSIIDGGVPRIRKEVLELVLPLSPRLTVTPSPLAPIGAVTATFIVGLLLRLILTSAQKIMVKTLTTKGVPQAVAVLIAATAPWMVDSWVTGTSPMVALYRLNKLIGRIGLDDWIKFANSMQRNERDGWKARSS